jgi:pSer/pThr/pTyr-binding forkhead associated (FHA) protein
MNLPGMTPFLEACGATGPLEVGIGSARHPEPIYYVLHQPFAVIGRDPRTDLMLHDEQVSKRHALLLILDGRAFCMDLGSRSGIQWDDRPGLAGWVDPQQCLSIGPFQLCVTGGCVREPWENVETYSPLSSQDNEALGLPDVNLTFGNGACDVDVWPMRSRIALVGRSPQCKVCLDGASVSRFHCALIRTPQGLWVADLLGRGGIAVNGQHTRYTMLHEGDRLQVGRFVVQIVSATIHLESKAVQEPADGPAEGLDAPGVEEKPKDRADPSADTDNYPLPDAGSEQSVNGPAITASAYLLLLNQFAAMQQQMFDEFQQAMLGMSQMFGALHKDQIEAIQAELDELRHMTRELQGMQAQMSVLPPAANGASVAVPPAASSNDEGRDPTLASLEPISAALGNGATPEVVPGACTSGESTISLHRPSPQREELAPEIPRGGASVPSVSEVAADSHTAPGSQCASLTEERKSPNPPLNHFEPSADLRSPENIRAVIRQRMAALHEERQSRWRRILAILMRAGDDRINNGPPGP